MKIIIVVVIIKMKINNSKIVPNKKIKVGEIIWVNNLIILILKILMNNNNKQKKKCQNFLFIL